MKKIIIVSPSFPHYREGLIKQLLSSEDVKYYFAGGHGNNSSIKPFNFDNSDRYLFLKNIWFGKYFVFQIGLLRYIKNIKPDVLVFTGDWKILSTWLYLIFCRFLKIQTYFWSHGLLDDKKSLNSFIKFLFFKCFSSGGFLYSNGAKEILKRRKFKGKLVVVYNSLNYNLQKLIAEKSNNVPSHPFSHLQRYLIFIGRITADRQLDLLVDALSIIEDKSIKVLLIGTGNYLNELKDNIDKRGLNSQFIFVGALYEESEIYAYFQNALACVFPGSIGLSMVHSFTYGVPVITHNNLALQKPECEALIDGVNGYYYKYNSSTDLADKIQRLFSLDESTLNRMKASAEKVVDNYYNPKIQENILNSEFIKNYEHIN